MLVASFESLKVAANDDAMQLNQFNHNNVLRF